jgi:hypothetical protein
VDLRPVFLPVLLRGTFAPFFRASDNAIAIACLRLFTFLPLPDRSVPFFLRRIVRSTFLLAALPYRRLPEDFRAAMFPPERNTPAELQEVRRLPYIIPINR